MYPGLSQVFAAALTGERTAVGDILQTTDTGTLAWRNGHTSILVVTALALAGLVDPALDWLEHAVDLGFSNHRFLGDLSPLLRPVRGDPRFRTALDIARHKERTFDS